MIISGFVEPTLLGYSLEQNEYKFDEVNMFIRNLHELLKYNKKKMLKIILSEEVFTDIAKKNPYKPININRLDLEHKMLYIEIRSWLFKSLDEAIMIKKDDKCKLTDNVFKDVCENDLEDSYVDFLESFFIVCKKNSYYIDMMDYKIIVENDSAYFKENKYSVCCEKNSNVIKSKLDCIKLDLFQKYFRQKNLDEVIFEFTTSILKNKIKAYYYINYYKQYSFENWEEIIDTISFSDEYIKNVNNIVLKNDKAYSLLSKMYKVIIHKIFCIEIENLEDEKFKNERRMRVDLNIRIHYKNSETTNTFHFRTIGNHDDEL